jgi:7-keto-8-aminopelargonate synthetase-like enzyme
MTAASRQERMLRLFEQGTREAMAAGIYRLRLEDRALRGDTITIRGHELVNFGLASYLGLNLDPRLKAGAIEAVSRYGPVYSSSTAFTALPLYTELEERLERMFEGHVVIAPTTTLAHLAALPLLVPEGSDVLIDAQAHESLRLAAQIPRASGSTISTVPHNDLQALAKAVERSSAESVWYLADGMYSMFGDLAPVREIASLMDLFPKLHVYFDDAHGFGWTGEHGKGYVLSEQPIRDRMVVAGSLSKSIGAGGGALVFPDEGGARRVRTLGGTMTFSGPLHPAELGAAIASADIHLSAELPSMQARLVEQIEHTRRLLVDAGLPVVVYANTPVWFVRIGKNEEGMEVAKRLQADGFYLNPSAYPAVPVGYAGLRFSNSRYLSDEVYEAMIASLTRHVTDVLSEPEVVIDLTEQRSHADPL